MRRPSYRVPKGVLLLLIAAACGAPSEPRDLGDLTPRESKALLITLAKPTWTWTEVAAPNGSGVRAALTNGSDRSLTSTIGDRFNDAMEQANLYIALGSNGAVEWRDASGVWRIAGLAHLVEGVKSVVLRPAGNYTLTALLREPRLTGTFRIRVDYFDAPNGDVRHSDYSGPFEIR